MLQTTYIYHSGFLVETPDALLVFDYWKDPAGISARILKSSKPLYVFISHHHKDHLNREVFSWRKDGNVKFIVSRDVYKFCRYQLRPDTFYNGVKPDPESVIPLRVGESYEDPLVSVKAYGSTDIGNSWVVRTGGFTLFHAGDLNAWIWLDESTQQEVDEAMHGFTRILDNISADCPKLDLAMFPVDSRIGREWYTGAKMFVRAIDVRLFVPMHFELGETEQEVAQRHADAVCFERYANPVFGCYAGLQQSGATAAVSLC